MKLVLVNAPGLGTMTQAGNNYITVTPPTGFTGSVTAQITADDTMKVDNMAVCTMITISVDGNIGQSGYKDVVTINGSTSNTTINNMPLIVMGDNGTGAAGTTAKVISCGQTSTSAE